MPPWQAYSGLSWNKCPICSVPTAVEPGRSYGKLFPLSVSVFNITHSTASSSHYLFQFLILLTLLTHSTHSLHVHHTSRMLNAYRCCSWWPTRITTWQTVQQFEQSRSPLPCSTPKWTQSQLSSLSWFKKRVSHVWTRRIWRTTCCVPPSKIPMPLIMRGRYSLVGHYLLRILLCVQGMWWQLKSSKQLEIIVRVRLAPVRLAPERGHPEGSDQLERLRHRRDHHVELKTPRRTKPWSL